MSVFVEPRQPSALELFTQSFGPSFAKGQESKQNMLNQLALLKAKQDMESKGVEDIMSKYRSTTMAGADLAGLANQGVQPSLPGAIPPEGAEIQPQVQPPQPSPIPDEKLIMALEASPISSAQRLGKSLRAERELKSKESYQQQKMALQKQEFGHAQTKPYREEMDRLSKNINAQSLSIDTMKDAIESGEINGWSKDFLTDVMADVSGVESFRNLKSLKGAQFVSAQKSMFSDLRELFPGQIRTAELTLFGQFLPQLGRSKEANLAVLGMLEATHAMKAKRLEAYNGIVTANNGYAPKNIASLVDNATKGDSKQIMDDYRKTFLTKQNIQQFKQSKTQPGRKTVTIVAPDGSTQSMPYNEEMIKKAVKLGGKVRRGY